LILTLIVCGGIIGSEESILKGNVFFSTIAFALIAIAVVGYSFTPIMDDCEAHGDIRVDGNPAPVGTELVAVIGADEVARTHVSLSGSYTLVIHAYNPENPDVKGYRSEDDVVTVYADGRKAEPSFNAKEGRTEVDLVVKTSLEVRQTTWGKIKALFK
jgi:hypothetical protein